MSKICDDTLSYEEIIAHNQKVIQRSGLIHTYCKSITIKYESIINELKSINEDTIIKIEKILALGVSHHELLGVAACLGYIEVLQVLTDKIDDIDIPLVNGMTSLMLAALAGNEAEVKFLLDKGASVHNTCSNQLNSLQYALNSQHEEVAIILVHAMHNMKLEETTIAEVKINMEAIKLFDKFMGNDNNYTFHELILHAILHKVSVNCHRAETAKLKQQENEELTEIGADIFQEYQFGEA